MVDLRAVDGGRPVFDTRQEADTLAEQSRLMRANEGIAFFGLPQSAKIDAVKAYETLSPHNITILESAKYYEKHVLSYKNAPLVKDMVARYIEDSTNRNLRPRAIEDITNRLNMFALDFGDNKLYEITIDELKDWVFDDEWKPLTIISYLTKISQLYNFALHNKWVDSNITEMIRRPKKDNSAPEIFTVEQANSLLKHSDTFGLLLYVTLGLFCGIRSAELLRMDCTNINLDAKTVTVPADAAKKRSQRKLDMLPVLLGWLEPHKKKIAKGGPIVENLRTNMELLRESAAITDWPANGLRHSFASYHLAEFESSDKTAFQMGHRSTDIVHNSYKALVSKADAARYWNLRP
jgi:integrase